MPESFTQVEYAVLCFLRAAEQSTIPAIASDLLLRLGETQETVLGLVAKGFVQREGDAYSPSAVALGMPLIKLTKTPVGWGALEHPLLAAASAEEPAPRPDVALVFKQARERAGRERPARGI